MILERTEAYLLIGMGVGMISLAKAKNPILYWLISFPGTLLHELAHWGWGKLTWSRPAIPDMFPRKVGNRWVLGSVDFAPGRFTCAFVALAPLSLLYFPPFFYNLAWTIPSWWWAVTCGFMLYLVASSSIPSRVDLVMAVKHPLSLVSYAAMLWLLWVVKLTPIHTMGLL